MVSLSRGYSQRIRPAILANIADYHTRPFERFLSIPSISSGDSLDWKDPTPADITKKVVDNVKSGSIVLFHNDLENTTEALPQVLEQLKQKGFEFITVSELIYPDSYKIDANGMQTPIVQSSADILPENIDEVMAQYSEQLHSAGFTDEQLELAANAVKSGAEIPQEVYDALAQYVMAEVPADGGLVTEESPMTPDADDPTAPNFSSLAK